MEWWVGWMGSGASPLSLPVGCTRELQTERVIEARGPLAPLSGTMAPVGFRSSLGVPRLGRRSGAVRPTRACVIQDSGCPGGHGGVLTGATSVSPPPGGLYARVADRGCQRLERYPQVLLRRPLHPGGCTRGLQTERWLRLVVLWPSLLARLALVGLRSSLGVPSWPSQRGSATNQRLRDPGFEVPGGS